MSTVLQLPGSSTPVDSSQLTNEEQQYAKQVLPAGQSMTTAEEKFLEDEINSYEYRQELGSADPTGHLNGLSGFAFPNHVSQTVLNNMLSFAENFANAAGWMYFPTGAQIMQAIGYNLTTQLDAAQFFSHWVPQSVKDSNPWITSGMTKDQWNQHSQSVDNTVSQYLGTGDTWESVGLDPQVKQWAINNGWDTERITNWLKDQMWDGSKFEQKYGYVKHGLTYSQFQQSLLDNKPQLEARYGVGGATAQNAISALDNPNVKYNTGGGGQGVQYQTQNNPAMTQTSNVR